MQATRSAQSGRLLLMMILGISTLAACSGASGTAPVSTPAPTVAVTTVPGPNTSPSTPPVTAAPPTTTTPPTTATSTTADTRPTATEPGEIPERSLIVPTAAAPTIDGTIDDREWSEAIAVSLSNGDTAYWQYNDRTLYVALDGTELGAVNLVIATEGELWILHSSAALGSSLFVQHDAAWTQSHGYTWCCRNGNDDTARLGLLEREGWQANIGFTGDVGVVEYEVVFPWRYSTVAIVYHAEGREAAYWPTDLSAEAATHIVTNQWTDPAFDPGVWWMLVPESPSD